MLIHRPRRRDSTSLRRLSRFERLESRMLLHGGSESAWANEDVSHFESDVEARFAAGSAEIASPPSAKAASLPGVDSTVHPRTYRIAVAATAEYTAFHGGTVAAGQAAIATTMSRVNEILESELAIHLELVADNDRLVYTDAANDPYANGDAFAMLRENQSNLDSVIGSSNYDVGHVFGTAGGGLSSLAVVGSDGWKARGVTTSHRPTGDQFDVNLFAHELGHQFGAHHTFNGIHGSCSRSRFAATAFEPGSGVHHHGLRGTRRR